jgi:hypothetical protein
MATSRPKKIDIPSPSLKPENESNSLSGSPSSASSILSSSPSSASSQSPSTPPRSPIEGSIKEREENKINYAYMNITQEAAAHPKDKFQPIKGVTYLWVCVPGEENEKKEMIVGIEEPWKYPQAFAGGHPDLIALSQHLEGDALWAALANEFRQQKWQEETLKEMEAIAKSQKGGRGHASLAAAFDKGQAFPEFGKAYIGGELKFEGGKWQLDNCSGRFGDIPNVTLAVVTQQMQEAVQLLKEAAGIEASFLIRMPKTLGFYQNKSIWSNLKDKASEKDNVLFSIQLLETYLASTDSSSKSERYKNEVRQILEKFKANKPQKMEDFMKPFEGFVKEQTDSKDPLMQALMFIARKTRTALPLSDAYIPDAPGEKPNKKNR